MGQILDLAARGRIGAWLAALVVLAVLLGGVPAAQALSWSSMAPPPAATDYADLAGVSCVDASHCQAVGGGAFGQQPLAEAWDGTSWSVEATPLPSGLTSGTLSAISCSSTTNCIAVGNSGQTMIAEQWNGSAWSPSTIANPGGESDVTLTGVSCVSDTDCTAAGWFMNSSTTAGLVAEHWDGTSWISQTMPTLAPNPGSTLEVTGVSCVPADALDQCAIVGSYSDAGGVHPLGAVENWPASGWQTTTVPAPPGDSHPAVQALSCPSASACVATGSDGTAGAMFGERWDGTAWTAQGGPAFPNTSAGYGITGLSCRSASSCETVGYDGSSMFVAHGDGTSWTQTDLTSSAPAGDGAGHLGGVSCPASAAGGECQAVGFSTDGNDRRGLALGYDSTGWSLGPAVSPPGGPGDSEMSVSCASTSACMAAGSTNGSGPVPTAEWWDGSSWNQTVAPTFPGATMSGLVGVSCGTATSCMAIGTGSSPSVSDQSFDERWNGTTWTLDTSTLPMPGPSTISWLNGVSCVAGGTCMAVGTWGSTSESPLAERWDGSSWTAYAPPVPSGDDSGQFIGVSCAPDGTCMAVGLADSLPDGKTVPIADHFDGTSWTSVTIPALATGASAQFYSVSCADSAHCMAVGLQVAGSTGSPFADYWTGSGFTPESLPALPAGDGGQLNGVSCAATTMCEAVGSIGSSTALLETWNGTNWVADMPISGMDTALDGVSCPSTTACVTDGNFQSPVAELFDAGITNPTVHPLSVSIAGPGRGSVSGTGIACPDGNGCIGSYADGSTVTLTATPSASPASHFAGWSGGGCSGTAPCTVAMSAAEDVVAHFGLGAPQPTQTTVSGTPPPAPGTTSGTGTTTGAGANPGTEATPAATPPAGPAAGPAAGSPLSVPGFSVPARTAVKQLSRLALEARKGAVEVLLTMPKPGGSATAALEGVAGSGNPVALGAVTVKRVRAGRYTIVIRLSAEIGAWLRRAHTTTLSNVVAVVLERPKGRAAVVDFGVVRRLNA